MKSVKKGAMELEDLTDHDKVSTEEHFFLFLICGFITAGGYRSCVILYEKYFGLQGALDSTSRLF